MTSRSGKKKDSQASMDPNAWMVTFGDLIMLLLTFFVMLLTMKSMDNKELKKMFREVSASSGPLEFVEGRIGGDVISGIGEEPKTVWIENADMLKAAFSLLEGAQTRPADREQIERIKEKLDIREEERGVVVTLEADNLFQSARADIRTDQLGLLDGVAAVLKTAANDIVIIGHTDNVPIRSMAFASNWELSLYRALSVYYYMIDADEMKPDKMAVGGAGDEMPRFPNNNPENRSKNRRVEFVIKKRHMG